MTRPLLLAPLMLVLFACETPTPREASLTDARGLTAGAPVRARGVAIGRVTEVSLGRGDAPVRVRLELDAGAQLEPNACATVGEGPSLVLEPGTPAPGAHADLPPCAVDVGSLLDRLRDRLPTLDDLPSLGEAAERAGAATREAAEGFWRGAAGDDSARDVGRAVGETLRELEQGVREGTETSTP